MRLSWSWSLVPKFTALDWELEEEGEEREGRRKGRPNLGELWKHSRGGEPALRHNYQQLTHSREPRDL